MSDRPPLEPIAPSASSPPVTDAAGPRARAGFGVLLLAQFLMVLDTTVVYVALPTMGRDLHLGPGGLPWVMDAYLLGLGGFLLVGGRLTEVLGRRRQFLAACGAFAAASVICGITPWGAVLFAGRFLQGVSAALVTPAAMALIGDLFPDAPRRGRAIAAFAGLGGIAGASGSLIGGVLMLGSWRLVFLINLPLTLITILAGQRLLPAHVAGARHLPNLGIAVMATLGLVLAITGVTQFGSGGNAPLAAALCAIGLVCLAIAIQRQRTSSNPLVPPAVLRSAGVPAGNLLTALVGFSLFGGFFVVTAYLQQVRGLEPLTAGLLMVPLSLALFAGSRVAAYLLAHRGAPFTTAAALFGQAAGLAAWSMWLTGPGAPIAAYLIPGLAWAAGVGMGLVAAFGTSTATVPGPLQGPAAGLVNTSLQLGGVLGVTILTIIITSSGHATGIRVAAVTAAAITVLALIVSIVHRLTRSSS